MTDDQSPMDVLRTLSIALLAMLLSGTTVAASSGSAADSSVPLYALRGPILIEDDAGFTAANGVISGSGTRGDPYVIAGWEIDGSGATAAIEIRNTRAHFEIRDAMVTGYQDGVVLTNVQNGRILNL